MAVGHLGEHAILIRPCPEPECNHELGHAGEHLFDGIPLPPMPSDTTTAIYAIPDCPKPDCNLLAGHKGKCVKKKVATPNMAGHNLEVFGSKKVAK